MSDSSSPVETDPQKAVNRHRRRRSGIRIVIYLSLAAVFYLLLPLAAAAPLVTAVLAVILLFGAFWEFLFWREVLFGHPESS